MRTLQLIAAVFLIIAGSFGSVQAQFVVDQEQPLISTSGGQAIGGDSEQKLAQTFTVGMTGNLAGLRLPISCDGSGNLVIEIRAVVDGMPTGPILLSVTVPLSELPTTVDGFVEFFFPVPLAVNAGDELAFTVQQVGEGSCGYASAPNGDTYPSGKSFFDARPNRPGWVASDDFVDGAHDLAFQTLMDDPSSDTGSRGNCVVQTSDGPTPLPIDIYVPVCRCFQDTSHREFRCGILHPDFFVIRRIPFPLAPGKPYLETWQFTSLTNLDAPIHMSISGGGLAKPTKLLLLRKGKRGKTKTVKLKGIAPEQATNVKGLALIEYDMKDAEAEIQRTFGIDSSIYSNQVGE